ncbi:hypothetical protein G9A89_002638 [Geosiphon pyriformis]|nr:hypothetical protein G9A89_002638 [Geosiphon pyriformis]
MAKTKITQKLSNGYGSEKRISVISKSASVNNGVNGDLDRENLSKMKAQTEAAADVFEEAASNWKAANAQILTLQSIMANGQSIVKKRSIIQKVTIKRKPGKPSSEESSEELVDSDQSDSVNENEEIGEQEIQSQSTQDHKTEVNETKILDPKKTNGIKRTGIKSLPKQSKKPKYEHDLIEKTVNQVTSPTIEPNTESLENPPVLNTSKIDDGSPILKSKKVPKTAYQYFVSKNFAAVKAAHPGIKMKEMSGKLGSMWTNLPFHEKEALKEELCALQQKYSKSVTQKPVGPKMPQTRQHSAELLKAASENDQVLKKSFQKSTASSSKPVSNSPSKHASISILKSSKAAPKQIAESSSNPANSSVKSSPREPIKVDRKKSTEIGEIENENFDIRKVEEAKDLDTPNVEGVILTEIVTETTTVAPTTPEPNSKSLSMGTPQSPGDSVPWILPIVGTPTSFGLSPYRKRKVRKSSASEDF